MSRLEGSELTLFSLMLLGCLCAHGQHEGHQRHTPTTVTYDSSQSMYPGSNRSVISTGNSVVYHLTISDTTVNYAGKQMPALATNGQIPAPALVFTEGDTAVLYVHNRTQGTVSFHWHGILLPNRFDGVPMLTTEVIEAGQAYLYKFKIIQHGTYWYHSHTQLQEQIGQYGPIVIHPQNGLTTKEKVIHLSDWVNERPWEVLRSLKRHNDWYAIKRKAVQTYSRALAKGYLGEQVWLEWKRMPAMDLADVYYHAFLANGRRSEDASGFNHGDRVRVRLINGSSSSNFWVQFSGGQMSVVAADGLEVTPIEVDKLFIATAETYDVEITIPDRGRHEFRASSWDASGHASVWFGEGTRHHAPALPRPNYFELIKEMKDMSEMMSGMTMGKAPKDVPETKVWMPGESAAPLGMDKEMDVDTLGKKKSTQHERHGMDHQSGVDSIGARIHKASEIGHAKMSMNEMDMGPMGTSMTGYKQVQAAFPDETLLNYDSLRALRPTTLPADHPVRTVHLYLTGNMFRYVWSINNLPLSRADKIFINRGENVRFVMHNTTMMSHPMHLHGHFFRVINKQGAYSPLKHTVNIAAMEMVTLEFEATEDKDWFFHCHLLYHMMSGMGRVVSYEGSDVPLNTKKKYSRFVSDDRTLFPFADVEIQSNGAFGEVAVRNTYWQYGVHGETSWQETNYEVKPKIQKFIGPRQFFAVYLGSEISKESQTVEGNDVVQSVEVATFGVRYFLPMHLWTDLRIDHKGNFKLEVEREEIPITQRWRVGGSFEYDLKDDWEYRFSTSYIVTKYTALSINYHSELGFGAGVTLIY